MGIFRPFFNGFYVKFNRVEMLIIRSILSFLLPL